MHKTGIVLSPAHYKNWQAEYIGNPTDSDGIYVILRNVAQSQYETFWNISIEAIEQTLRKHNIVILWEDEKPYLIFYVRIIYLKRWPKRSFIIFIAKRTLK